MWKLEDLQLGLNREVVLDRIYVELKTNDLSATKAWYMENLGFKQIGSKKDEQGHEYWIQLSAHLSTISFEETEEKMQPLSSVKLKILIKGMEKYIPQIEARLNTTIKLAENDFGSQQFEITDPNGLTICFIQDEGLI